MFFFFLFFFFNVPATTEIYTLSLHDALPIWVTVPVKGTPGVPSCSSLVITSPRGSMMARDRKSTRLNSSHQIISYAVFCLKKKNFNLTIVYVVLFALVSIISALLG